MKKVISLFAALAVLSVGGCSVSVESLLSPPKLDEEQAAIYNALTLSKGGDIHLKYPVSGQYRSAFIVQNIDDEATDEAIVFYEASNVADGGSSLRINFLDKQDGEWVSLYDFAALGSDIERVCFAELGDNKTSILVTYTLQNSSDLATSIFRYENNTPSEVYKSRHSFMELLDINDDGTDEIFLINRDSASGITGAYLLGWTDNDSFSIISEAPLSENFSRCEKITKGNYDVDEQKGIFVEYSLTDGSVGTELLVCEGRSFYNTQIPPAQLVRRNNTYSPVVYSRDIDNDGIMEIPSSSPFPGYENLPPSDQINMTLWYQILSKGASINREYISYVSIRNDYMLNIPSRWIGLITAKISIADGTIVFSHYDSVKKEAAEELLIIRAVHESALEKTDLEGFADFGKNQRTGYCFYIKNHAELSFALTDAELKDCFKILE